VLTASGIDISLLLSYSGEGTGDGVIRTVLEEVIKTLITNSNYWRQGLEEGYFTLAPRLESSQARRIQIKAHATLILVAIFHRISPDPISPFLLAQVLVGKDILEDRRFMKAVSPLTHEAFLEWPLDDSPVPRTTKNQTLLANLDIQVLLICRMSYSMDG